MIRSRPRGASRRKSTKAEIFSLPAADLRRAVQAIAEENLVYGVKEKPPGFGYDRLFPDDEPCLDYGISILPPNYYFLPPGEALVRFRLAPEVKPETPEDYRPFVILGVHPFDLHGIKTLDAVFLNALPDPNYRARRESALLIGVDCLNPWPYSFAPSMGTALPPPIFDLWITPLPGHSLVEVGSEKGRSLLLRHGKWKKAGKGPAAEREAARRESMAKYKLSLHMSAPDIPAVLDSGWESPMWEELGRKCFACGSCTMVCPTCVCFDLLDRMNLDRKGAERYRNPDSCMFIGFDRLATGESFRPSGEERLRHRLHRKGKYMLQRWGALGCVGCGRCIRACLVDIASPVYAYNRLWEEKQRKEAGSEAESGRI